MPWPAIRIAQTCQYYPIGYQNVPAVRRKGQTHTRLETVTPVRGFGIIFLGGLTRRGKKNDDVSCPKLRNPPDAYDIARFQDASLRKFFGGFLMPEPTAAETVEQLDMALDRDIFMRTLIRELSGTLEEVVGLNEAAGYISVVGQNVGDQMNRDYKAALGVAELSREQVGQVLVDLKRRINGTFYIIEESPEKIVLGNSRCTFWRQGPEPAVHVYDDVERIRLDRGAEPRLCEGRASGNYCTRQPRLPRGGVSQPRRRSPERKGTRVFQTGMTPADFELHYGVLPEPMLLASPAGRICAANEPAVHLLNRTAAELAQLSIADLAADPPETVARLLARFSRSGQFVPGALALNTSPSEILVCRVEGALIRVTEGRWLLLRFQPQEDAVRRFRSLNERIAHLNREIFDRTLAMRESALLSAIVDSSDDAIMSKDLTGVIMSWNKGAQRLFGFTAAEAIGRSITIILPPERLDEEGDILRRVARGERIERLETIRRRKDGVPVSVSLTISPVKDADGRVIGASKIAHDITARAAQEKALITANEALKRANADLEQFAYSASHDLQEPLRMVATYSEMLKKRFNGQLGEEGEEYIGYTIEGAMRMERLLKALRIYTQVSTGELRPEQPVDADDVLR